MGKTARNMELISLNLNAASAAGLLNGFAGVILIFANHAIRNRLEATMFQGKRKMSYLNAMEWIHARLKFSILLMAMSMH